MYRVPLPDRLERHKLPPLICLERQMAYIVGSRLLIWIKGRLNWRERRTVTPGEVYF